MIELRVIVGGDNMIYCKRVRLMPVLPVGSSVRIDEELDLCVFGYWFSVKTEVTVCWLAHWIDLQKAYIKRLDITPTFHAIESPWMKAIDIGYKQSLIDAGFERSGQRIETAWH